MSDKQFDELTGTQTTGHVWDGITELDTPMPLWWLWIFYGTIAFALVYVVLYPAIPLINSATQGTLGWNSRAALEEEVKIAASAQSGLRDKIAAASMEEIVGNDELLQFSVSAGRSAYAVNCSPCHGSGAAGSPGYPNLQDDEWIWGSDLQAIHDTIAHGVRNGGDAARDSQMPAFGTDGVLDPTAIENVSAHVVTLAGGKPEFGDAAAGQQIFAENCAACHGEAGEGMAELGAPRLADPIYLYGGDQAQIAAQISAPKHGIMPGWAERLGDVTVKQLAVYVYSLSGGAK